ncbi:MAG: hypothetical protein EA391_06330 [Balneolaceae bacterium]|nr:MAG: hypothetical protein EA391_06330 [Balneolaceae bacterium]
MTIYAGNYIEVLKTFHETLGVNIAISEKRNVDSVIVEYCSSNKITLFLAENSAHLDEYLDSLPENIKLCLVASFGLLLKNRFIEKTEWTVNIHPGDLKTCRGRHPLPFAIVKGLPMMTLTAHLIEDEKIDNGPVLAEFSIPIDYTKSYSSNDLMLRSNLPFITNLILSQVKEKGELHTAVIDLKNAPYNKRLDADTLNEVMNSKNLLKYCYL